MSQQRYTVRGTRNVAQTFAASPLDALVYLSSTSVYGRRHGEHTDEATQVDPASPLGCARTEPFERRVSARRCSNRRMRDELGVVPRYPSVRVGLAAALRAEGAI